MIELFRFIEHAFPKPADNSDYINVSGDSAFQSTITDLRSSQDATSRMKEEASNYLAVHFSNGKFDITQRDNYNLLHKQVSSGKDLNAGKTKDLIEKIFDSSLRKVSQSDWLRSDKQLANDGIVAHKLMPAFEKADATEMVRIRQAIGLIESLSESDENETTDIKKLLWRPLLVPASLLLPTNAPGNTSNGQDNPDPLKQVVTDFKEMQDLGKARRALLSLQADDFEVKPGEVIERTRVRQPHENIPDELHRAPGPAAMAAFSRLTISNQAYGQLHTEVRSTLSRFDMQAAETDIPLTVNRIEQKISDLSGKLQSFMLPPPAHLFKLGIHLFTAQPSAFNTVTVSEPVVNLSAPRVKPLGIGNLQIVKQELIKYEAGEVSHIENILEKEKYRRETVRNESTEVTVTQEHETVNTQERDLQSTERNEMVSESQKEVSKQSVSSKEQTTTTDYGKLVENNKSTYARSITDRVVTSLTEKVREQRVQREMKSFTETTLHEFDNSTGGSNIRGIYQWVNKRYKHRVLNYGKRLLYDVTVPQPAAFLLDSLKNAVQPEGMNIYKPQKPAILSFGSGGNGLAVAGIANLQYKPLEPKDIDSTNYMSLAATYGAAGAVDTPPNNFVNATAWLSCGPNAPIFKSEKITIEKGYKAISGYFQSTNWLDANGVPAQNNDGAELNIGESHFFKMDTLSRSFKMNGETGDIPITFCAGGMVGHNVAVVITSLNDQAMAKWQLKTYAAVMDGYRKQMAEYEDKLRQVQTTIKAQLMLAQNYTHNTAIERDELKKAFIHLIINEQFGKAYIPSPDPLQFPFDSKYVQQWGALVSFFERAFEWENMMYVYYPYFWAQRAKWQDLVLIEHVSPPFEEFLKAGAARVVVPVRPGFEAPVAHFHETGEVWMGKEMPDMFSEQYISIINEINERNFAPGKEKCVAEWEVVLPTSLVMLKADENLPEWTPSMICNPEE